MRKLLILLAVLTLCGGCDKIGGPKARYSKLLDAMGELKTTLQQNEQAMNDYLMMKNTPEGSCRAALGLDAIKNKVKKARAELDALKPADLPTKKDTRQVGVDPNTNQPIIETDVVVDWGKVTGDEQKMWANINSAEYAISTGADMLSIACKCVDGGDKESPDCAMAGFQFMDGKFSLGLAPIEDMYLKTSRELVEKM